MTLPPRRSSRLAQGALALATLLAPPAAIARAQAPVQALVQPHAAAPPQLAWSLNCGGAALSLPDGPSFLADQPYQPGGAGYEGGQPLGKPTDPLGGYLNPGRPVQVTAREGWTAYRFDVPNGRYLVRLHLAEVSDSVSGPDLRSFGVRAEGTLLLDDLDLAATLGFRYGATFAAAVDVADGRLDLVAEPGGDPAVLSGVEVWRLPGPASLPGSIGPLEAFGTYGRNVLTWKHGSDPSVVGYRVWRGDAPGGPFAPVATTWAAPPRFLDDAVPNGRTAYYRVAALNVDGDLGPPSATVAATPRAPADSPLRVYTIEIDAANLAQLNQDPKSDDEVPATFRFQGLSYPVQVRYRGGGSRLQPKKSWKVKFPPFALFEGRSDLNLKSQWIDPSMLREAIARELFLYVGHPVARHRRVHLEVNGEFAGVFNELEQLDETYLAARDRDTSGAIHKATANPMFGTNFKVLPSTLAYQTSYPLKINEGVGYAGIQALVELVNDPATTAAQLADVFDVEGFLSYAAVIGWTGDADQANKNYHLYHDPTLDRWEWITWDNDRSLYDSTHPIDGATSTCGTCGVINFLKDRVLGFPRFRQRYGAKLEALTEGPASAAVLPAVMAALHREIRTDALVDVHDQGWESPVPFLQELAELQGYVAARNAFVLAQLPAYVGATPSPTLWINEVLVRSQTGALDEQGEPEPWIELYNGGSSAESLGGVFLTDDLGDPFRWPIPAGTTIPAGGHLVIWADGEPADGPLHASFRLAGEGGELAVFGATPFVPVDFVALRPQVPDVSLGRRTDAGPFFAPLPTPTPGAPNTTAGNLPPLVTWVTHDAVPLAGVPVSVTCLVTDADPLAELVLVWRLDGGAFREDPLVPIGSDRYEAVVPGEALGSLVEYHVRVRDALGATTVKPYDAPAELYAYTITASAVTGLVVNEVVADNDSILADETGAFEDYVELYNGSSATIDLTGRYLTDDLFDPQAWTFPAGTLLGAGQHLLVWCDGDTGDGPLHASFALSKGGESIGLFDTVAAGLGLIDGFAFGPQATDVALARMPDGAPLLATLFDPTPGAANAPAAGGVAVFDATTPNPVLLAAGASPEIDQLFPLFVGGASPATPGVVLVGLQTTEVALPPSGTQLVLSLPALSLAIVSDAGGLATAVLDVPNDPTLIGTPLFLQAATTADGFSNAVAATPKGP